MRSGIKAAAASLVLVFTASCGQGDPADTLPPPLTEGQKKAAEMFGLVSVYGVCSQGVSLLWALESGSISDVDPLLARDDFFRIVELAARPHFSRFMTVDEIRAWLTQDEGTRFEACAPAGS